MAAARRPIFGEQQRFMVLLIAPAALLLGLFQVVPIVIGANASFRDWALYNPKKTWVGLDHYKAVITDPAFLARAEAIGERMRAALLAIQARHPRLVGDVRGLGPMLAMELVKDPDTREPWLEATQQVNAATLQRGLITIRAGLFSNCVRLLPPLTISDAELDEAMAVLSASVDAVAAALGVA